MQRWDARWMFALSLGLGACTEDPTLVSGPGGSGDTGATESASADDSAAGVCGNGMVEPGEDCDDPNGDPLDGCLDDCRFGPTGFAPGVPFATPTRGNDLGDTFDDACPPGQALIGVEGRVGESSGTIRRLRGICGELELQHQDGAFVVRVNEAEVLPTHGASNSSDNAESFCPDDQIVVGFEGQANAEVITILRLHCAPPVVVDTGSTFELQLNALTRSDPMGTDQGAEFPLATCGDGIAALETNMRASNRIHGFGLDCAPLSLVLGP